MDRPQRSRQSKYRMPTCVQSGFTVLELLVAIGVVGVMLSLLLPAILFARESGRRTICSNQLHQIGLAIHQHHNWQERLPPAWRVAADRPDFAFGWAAFLLPGIEESSALPRWDLNRAPDAAKIDAAVLTLMTCPSDLTEPSFDLYAANLEPRDHEGSNNAEAEEHAGEVLLRLPTASYVGVYGTVEADESYSELREGTPEYADGAIVFDRVVKFADLTRGLSKTLLVGERTMSMVPSTWLGVDLRGEDAECRLAGSAMTHPNCETCDECEFSSRHAGGAYFLWADGHVELVAETIDPSAYRELARRSTQ
jgi:prepilin-type processing-associated H-X9-DG protein/prepilin-type N-terminal cleavage/methylation domain-containing protein